MQEYSDKVSPDLTEFPVCRDTEEPKEREIQKRRW